MDFRSKILAFVAAPLAMLPVACADTADNSPPSWSISALTTPVAASPATALPPRASPPADDCDVRSGDATRDNLMAYVCAMTPLLDAQQHPPASPPLAGQAPAPAATQPAPPPHGAAASSPAPAAPPPAAVATAPPPPAPPLAIPAAPRFAPVVLSAPAGQPAVTAPGVPVAPQAVQTFRVPMPPVAWSSPRARDSRLNLVPPDGDAPAGGGEYVYILLDGLLTTDRADALLRRSLYCPLWETMSDAPPARDEVEYVVPVRSKPAPGEMPEYDYGRAHRWLVALKNAGAIPRSRSLDGTAFVVERASPMIAGDARETGSQIGALSPTELVQWVAKFRSDREAEPMPVQYENDLPDVDPPFWDRVWKPLEDAGGVAKLNVGLKFPSEPSLACESTLPPARRSDRTN